MVANVARTYDGERIPISATAFRDCTFRECELVFDGRPVEMTGCTMEGCTMEGCRWVFEGPAAYTVEFIQLMVTNEPDLRTAWGMQLGFYNDNIVRPVLLN